jgi:hypothetical protein
MATVSVLNTAPAAKPATKGKAPARKPAAEQ